MKPGSSRSRAPRGRPGRAQPDAPPGLPEVGVRRRLSGHRARRCASSASSATARCIARPRSGAWREAETIAAAALDGYVETSVGSATHYHADYVAPRWAPMLTKIAKLGAHIFYRWPGAWGQPAAFTGRYIGEPQDPLALRPPLRAR